MWQWNNKIQLQKARISDAMLISYLRSFSHSLYTAILEDSDVNIL